MYLPDHFEVTDLAEMRELISLHPLGVLVTIDADGLHADHIPFLWEAATDQPGWLIGHVARANRAWTRTDVGSEAMVVFRGSSAYISPNWYPTKQETHRVVPTYNYAVVHVYGPLVVHEDAKWVRDVVGKLTKRMESVFPEPWKMSDAPADYTDEMLTKIVGIEIPISRAIGKWKVSQNRVEVDRIGAISGLRAAGEPEQVAMAELIATKMGGES